jgi:hypothetical protein
LIFQYPGNHSKGQRYLTDDVKQRVQHEREWADFDAEMRHYAEQREETLRERQAQAVCQQDGGES